MVTRAALLNTKASSQYALMYSLLATGKVVLGISWSESTCCVCAVCRIRSALLSDSYVGFKL